MAEVFSIIICMHACKSHHQWGGGGGGGVGGGGENRYDWAGGGDKGESGVSGRPGSPLAARECTSGSNHQVRDAMLQGT